MWQWPKQPPRGFLVKDVLKYGANLKEKTHVEV